MGRVLRFPTRGGPQPELPVLGPELPSDRWTTSLLGDQVHRAPLPLASLETGLREVRRQVRVAWIVSGVSVLAALAALLALMLR